MNLTILGAGSFGTALANHVAKLGNDVRLWCRSATQAETINVKRANPRYLKECRLREEVRADTDLESAIAFGKNTILALPAQSLRDVLLRLVPLEFTLKLEEKKFLNLSKGIEIASGKLPYQIMEEVLPNISYSALSGPSHAEEVVRDLPTAVVIASRSHTTAQEWQMILNSPHFRVYTSDDLTGIELGGAVKNVIAVAMGVAEALNFGDNAKAALATRGLAEITRLGVALGASPLTLAGLAGVGDLMATCYSRHSRNLRLGLAIGRGLNVEEAVAEIGQVVEGVHTVKALVAYGRRVHIELPIAEGVHDVLYEGASIEQVLEKLLFREPKPERHASELWPTDDSDPATSV
ncbi:MAG: NAD(P)-dependent glycerol-3-phosphate dehydrogenase [Synergistaceae bacterium]|jgi:glycerol-3-phosphate dehydrogenase (NAD(P)+)|nr:NAD(P)-dependent glycerol-3-phosphate dehydrogenase [Synergistaceae bacterium]